MAQLQPYQEPTAKYRIAQAVDRTMPPQGGGLTDAVRQLADNPAAGRAALRTNAGLPAIAGGSPGPSLNPVVRPGSNMFNGQPVQQGAPGWSWQQNPQQPSMANAATPQIGNMSSVLQGLLTQQPYNTGFNGSGIGNTFSNMQPGAGEKGAPQQMSPAMSTADKGAMGAPTPSYGMANYGGYGGGGKGGTPQGFKY